MIIISSSNHTLQHNLRKQYGLQIFSVKKVILLLFMDLREMHIYGYSTQPIYSDIYILGHAIYGRIMIYVLLTMAKAIKCALLWNMGHRGPIAHGCF